MPITAEQSEEKPRRGRGWLWVSVLLVVLPVLSLLVVPLAHPITLRLGRPTLLVWAQPASAVKPRYRRPGVFSYDLAPPLGAGGRNVLGTPDGKLHQAEGTAFLRGFVLGDRVYFLLWFKGRRV